MLSSVRSLTQSCAPCSQRLGNKLQFQGRAVKAITKLQGTIHLGWITGWLNEKWLGTWAVKNSVYGFQKVWLPRVKFRSHCACDKTPSAFKRAKKSPGSCAKWTDNETEWHEMLKGVYLVHYQKQFRDSGKAGWVFLPSKSSESHLGFLMSVFL